MFPAEIEDTPLHRRIVEFFGKRMLEEAADEGRREGRDEGRREGRDEGRRLGLAELIVRHAHRNQLPLSLPDDDAVAALARRADEDTLLRMADALPQMNDAFRKFLDAFNQPPAGLPLVNPPWMNPFPTMPTGSNPQPASATRCRAGTAPLKGGVGGSSGLCAVRRGASRRGGSGGCQGRLGAIAPPPPAPPSAASRPPWARNRRSSPRIGGGS